jgi:fructokinase
VEEFGAIDAGGTSWRCAIFKDHAHLVARIAFPTTTPEETLAKAILFFTEQAKGGHKVKTIGIGCFGPLGVNKANSNWGHILVSH